MNLFSALGQIKSGRRSILFLGAGFSNDTQNIAGRFTPSSSQLAGRILDELQIPGSAPLGLAIDKLREKRTPDEAFRFIEKELTVKSLSDRQRFILSLPWHRIYTTNVDNIGSDHSKKKWHDAVKDDEPVSVGDFVYLHGCISNCTPTNYYGNLKLGEQLYLQNSRAGAGYYHALKQDLYDSDAVFVIGYSMADPDFATIFYNSEDLINKCFVFSGKPDELSAHRISLIGTNTNQSIADLENALRNRPAEREPAFRSEIIVDPNSFDTKEVTQSASQNLLIFGRYDDSVARTSWNDGKRKYAIKRSEAIALSNFVPPRIVVVHSHLGNGKSMLFHYARFILAAQNKQTFTIKSDVSNEGLIDALSEIPPGSHVFFEGDIFSVADTSEVVRIRSLVLCVTSRSTTIRVAMPALANKAQNIVQLIDANCLSYGELTDFHDLIDAMAFWPPDLVSLPRNSRLSRLQDQYGSNINAIVLKIFENKRVEEEILRQWQVALRGLAPILDHVVVASYMQMIDISVPAYILNEFQNMDYKVLKNFENDIIRVEYSGNISFGNPIIGEFVLRNHTKRGDIVGAVVRFVNFIDSHPSQRSFQWIVRRLLRYWNLHRLLNSPTAPDDILDKASFIPSVDADPLFWVQYSISQMENNNFLGAERFLSRAYERANGRRDNFDPYQIDTHAARLTFRKIIANGFYDGASKDVLNAIGKLRSVVKRRSDDSYHVSSVVVLALKADIPWDYVLKDKDYSVFKNDLQAIGASLNSTTINTPPFAIERQALDLINKRFRS